MPVSPPLLLPVSPPLLLPVSPPLLPVSPPLLLPVSPPLVPVSPPVLLPVSPVSSPLSSPSPSPSSPSSGSGGVSGFFLIETVLGSEAKESPSLSVYVAATVRLSLVSSSFTLTVSSVSLIPVSSPSTFQLTFASGTAVPLSLTSAVNLTEPPASTSSLSAATTTAIFFSGAVVSFPSIATPKLTFCSLYPLLYILMETVPEPFVMLPSSAVWGAVTLDRLSCVTVKLYLPVSTSPIFICTAFCTAVTMAFFPDPVRVAIFRSRSKFTSVPSFRVQFAMPDTALMISLGTWRPTIVIFSSSEKENVSSFLSFSK